MSYRNGYDAYRMMIWSFRHLIHAICVILYMFLFYTAFQNVGAT